MASPQENPQLPDGISKYATLHERGVLLSDDGIDFVVDHLDKGIHHTMDYIGEKDTDSWPLFVSLNEGDSMGYLQEAQAVNIPIPFLNSLANSPVPLSEYPIRAYQIWERGIIRIVELPEFLTRVGEHEAAHHYQCTDHPFFHARPQSQFGSLSPIKRVLTDMECDARQTADLIAESLGEKPLWNNLDDYLKETYQGAYGKSAATLFFYNLGQNRYFSTGDDFPHPFQAG
jgi:hypothetical protein